MPSLDAGGFFNSTAGGGRQLMRIGLLHMRAPCHQPHAACSGLALLLLLLLHLRHSGFGYLRAAKLVLHKYSVLHAHERSPT
jgi:hypothetical protein